MDGDHYAYPDASACTGYYAGVSDWGVYGPGGTPQTNNGGVSWYGNPYATFDWGGNRMKHNFVNYINQVYYKTLTNMGHDAGVGGTVAGTQGCYGNGNYVSRTSNDALGLFCVHFGPERCGL